MKWHVGLGMVLVAAAGVGVAAALGAREEKAMPKDMSHLTPMQYEVTQESKTEPAFHNAYWNNKEEGIYVDVVSGEPLFSSTDKFDSGTGWPSFTKPIEPQKIIEKEDNTYRMQRTEIRSEHGHLGHVFTDGPTDKGGMRYCVNSAALRFVPRARMAEEGYGDYLYLFENQSK